MARFVRSVRISGHDEDVEGALPPFTRHPKVHPDNRLNELTPQEWLRFQKSWFVLNPPPREKGVLLHPAKFPERLVFDFVRFFTKPGMRVLDPMAGTGSTLVGCAMCGRNAVGVELSPRYANIARQRLEKLETDGLELSVIEGDASRISELVNGPFDYCITSPPYWDMLRANGAETQQRRRQSDELDLYYSDDDRDLGNVRDYREFVEKTASIYRKVSALLKPGAYLTVVVKNVKKRGTVYPLAWDLARGIGEFMMLKDEKIWCQDNQKLSPFGYRYAWVSNTMHHYCLNFKNKKGNPPF